MFADDWTALAAGLESPTIPYPRVLFLSRFDLPPDDAFDVWDPRRAPRPQPARPRRRGQRLYANIADLDPDDSDAVAPWRALVLDLLATNEASEVLSPMLYSAGELRQLRGQRRVHRRLRRHPPQPRHLAAARPHPVRRVPLVLDSQARTTPSSPASPTPRSRRTPSTSLADPTQCQ
jgi:hypothetical protein